MALSQRRDHEATPPCPAPPVKEPCISQLGSWFCLLGVLPGPVAACNVSVPTACSPPEPPCPQPGCPPPPLAPQWGGPSGACAVSLCQAGVLAPARLALFWVSSGAILSFSFLTDEVGGPPPPLSVL